MKETRKLMGLALALALLAGAGSALAAPVRNKALDAAAEPPLTRQRFEAGMKRIEVQYRADREACRRLQGERRALCDAQAKGKERAAKARLEARFEGTPDAILQAKEVTAEANYQVARKKCGTLPRDARDGCMGAAKAAREAALRQARVEHVESTGGIFGRKDGEAGRTAAGS